MLAAIDAGSNTLRLLVGKVVDNEVVPSFYLRRISRLAGGFSEQEGLSPAAMERALFVFQEFAEACQQAGASQVRAVGTAAFRQAVNGEAFASEINWMTRVPLEIISGQMEAEYMVAGVLSALDPVPDQVLIVDIGGGSTEFVLCLQQKIVWSRSLPLGVVRLAECCPLQRQRQKSIDDVLAELVAELADVCDALSLNPVALTLVGTAGSVTTLAALDMQMTEYDWRQVNNYSLSLARLQEWYGLLIPLCCSEREALPGMEAGRGDLIVAGLEIVLGLMQRIRAESLTVSDFGILEGLLLSMQKPR